jgi:hypothetical protein
MDLRCGPPLFFFSIAFIAAELALVFTNAILP